MEEGERSRKGATEKLVLRSLRFLLLYQLTHAAHAAAKRAKLGTNLTHRVATLGSFVDDHDVGAQRRVGKQARWARVAQVGYPIIASQEINDGHPSCPAWPNHQYHGPRVKLLTFSPT